MRDLPAPSPTAQQALARMYAQRVPSRPKQIGRMPEQRVDQPWYEKAGRAAFGIVASPFATALDVVPGYEPEDIGSFNIFEQGGKSLQHVAGDAYQLGRSVLTGKDTLSESPSARAYQQAGGGLMGAAAAALPYVDVASAAAPFAKAMTPAGALAMEKTFANTATRSLENQLADEVRNLIQRRFAEGVNVPLVDGSVDIEGLFRNILNKGFNWKNYPKDANSIKNYISSNYETLNRLARDPNARLYQAIPGTPVYDQIRSDALYDINNISRLIASAPPLRDPVTVYRGLTTPSANDAYSQALRSFLKNAKPGDILEPGRSFMSTSFDQDIANNFGKHGSGWMFEINLPRGSRGIAVDPFTTLYPDRPVDAWTNLGEREFLLPRNTRLQLIKQRGKHFYFDAIPGSVHPRPFEQTPMSPAKLRSRILAQ